MYDAVVLYAKALNKSFVSSGNQSVYDNGAFMFEQMKNVEFQSIDFSCFAIVQSVTGYTPAILSRHEHEGWGVDIH
jgi:hypothetical protein